MHPFQVKVNKAFIVSQTLLYPREFKRGVKPFLVKYSSLPRAEEI
jgi:hypothetical protein